MSWTRYLFHDWFTARELNRIDEKFRDNRRARSRSGSALKNRVAQLEDDVGRLTLLVKALSEVAIEKGAFARADLMAWLERIDILDGTADGKLDADELGFFDATDEPDDEPPALRVRRRRRR